MKPALSISSWLYIISTGTEEMTSTCEFNFGEYVTQQSTAAGKREIRTHHKPSVYVSLSDLCMVHDEQAVFVIEPCVEIQKHVRDEHQIHNPVYDLHDKEQRKNVRFGMGELHNNCE